MSATGLSFWIGRLLALVFISGVIPILFGLSVALGISVVDLLTPGPVAPTLKALVGWPADASTYGAYTFVGMLVSLPASVYVVTVGWSHIISDA